MDISNTSILLVNDEKKFITQLSGLFTKEGYIVDTAMTGNDAIKKFDTEKYDILITDLNLPDMNGFEIIEYLKMKKIDTLPLVLTAYGSMESAIHAIHLGAYDFIQKPVDRVTLKLIVHRAAERVALNKEKTLHMIELTKLNKLKNEFIAVVSHDLRSPLSTIGGYAHYLIKKGNLNNTQEKYVSIIKELADNVYILVNELLDVTRLETGIIQLHKEDTDIIELIGQSIEHYKHLLLEKNNIIEFNNILVNPIIRIDKIKILQIMNNLINNANKFTEDGTIAITVIEATPGISISVRDSGIGIPGDVLEKIFEGNPAARTIGTKGEEGTGLGLIICKKFIEMHGGTISATSVVQNGSTFEIYIPRHQ